MLGLPDGIPFWGPELRYHYYIGCSMIHIYGMWVHDDVFANVIMSP